MATKRRRPIELDTGSAHGGIVTVADRVGAGLIVVGPGTTAQRAARSASGPVLVARESPTGSGVIGATDFSDPSLPAVNMAADEARRRGVRLLEVVSEGEVLGPPPVPASSRRRRPRPPS